MADTNKTTHPLAQDGDPFGAVALLAARGAVMDAERHLEVARHKRDAAIVTSSAAGLTRRQVAELSGVTVGRVQQILTEAGHGA